MSNTLKEILARAESWPRKAQNQALQSLLIIEARHTGPTPFSADEWEGFQESANPSDLDG